MTMDVQVAISSAPARPPRDLVIATLFPTLWPSMLLGRRPATGAWPFPIDHPQARYPYLARYGIYRAAHALGLAGRDILFPAFFHCVELDALLAAGVRPRFYPVGENLSVDVEQIAARIGPSTAAVYLIHYAGFPGPVEALGALCREHGIALIEDCAHALASHVGDRPLGSFGDAAVFSLPKVVPVPNGGIVLIRGGWPDSNGTLRRPSTAAVAGRTVSAVLQNLAMRRVAGSGALRRAAVRAGKAAFRTAGIDHMPTGTPEFHRSHVGFVMSPVAWRVLRSQDFPTVVERRRRHYLRLQERLGDLIPPMVGSPAAGVTPLFYPFQVDHRDALLKELKTRGVEIGEFWPDWHPVAPRQEFPQVDRIRRTALWLPCHQDLTMAAVDRLAGILEEAVVKVRG